MAEVGGGLSVQQLRERGMLVSAYRVVVVGIACACVVAAAKFIARTLTGQHDQDQTTAVVIVMILASMFAYGLFLNWVVGRNWRRYRTAAQAGQDPGSYIAVLYPSHWPL